MPDPTQGSLPVRSSSSEWIYAFFVVHFLRFLENFPSVFPFLLPKTSAKVSSLRVCQPTSYCVKSKMKQKLHHHQARKRDETRKNKVKCPFHKTVQTFRDREIPKSEEIFIKKKQTTWAKYAPVLPRLVGLAVGPVKKGKTLTKRNILQACMVGKCHHPFHHGTDIFGKAASSIASHRPFLGRLLCFAEEKDPNEQARERQPHGPVHGQVRQDRTDNMEIYVLI